MSAITLPLSNADFFKVYCAFYISLCTASAINRKVMKFLESKSLNLLQKISPLFLVCLLFASPLNAEPIEKIDGSRLYLISCAQCHGMEGKGDGINATFDMINPQDHTDARYMSMRSDERLNDSISGGGTEVGKSPTMPPWKATYTEREIDSIVAYLRVLCDCSYSGLASDEKLRKIDPDFK